MILSNIYKILLISFLSLSTYACPGCAGSMEDPKNNYIVAALCIFVLLTYIPFYLIYRTIIKNRNLNNFDHSNGTKNS